MNPKLLIDMQVMQDRRNLVLSIESIVVKPNVIERAIRAHGY